MVSYHTGWMYFADYFGNPSEIVNEHRTRANMLRAKQAGLTPFFDDVNPLRPNSCSTLGFEPCSMTLEGAVTSWAAIDTDVNEAPWYSTVQAAASNEGFGFWIEEWTGMDGSHHARSSMPRGSSPYGGTFGLQTQRERVMAINLIAVGYTERGLNHLFRWLEATLLATCSRCDTNSLYLREHCPGGVTSTALEDGLVRADHVALIAGPTWESPPVEDADFHLRRISFTLAAADPCLRRVAGALNTSFATYAALGSPSGYVAGCDVYSGSSQRQSLAVTAPAYGMNSPIVTITSAAESTAGVRLSLPALRIAGFDDKNLLGSFKPCAQERIGLITLDGIPSGWDVVVDCGSGEITARDKYGDRDWVDGSSFVQANTDYDASYDGRRTINFTNCLSGYVLVEPALGGTVSIIGAPSGYASAWTTTIQMQERFGCSG